MSTITLHADDEAFAIHLSDLPTVSPPSMEQAGPDATFHIPAGVYAAAAFHWTGTWAGTTTLFNLVMTLKLGVVDLSNTTGSTTNPSGDGAFAPAFVPILPATLASILALINAAAGGDLTVLTDIVYNGGVAADATFTTIALTLVLTEDTMTFVPLTPAPFVAGGNFEILPVTETTYINHASAPYTIYLKNPAGVGGQAFTLGEGTGGTGTFSPVTTVTVPAGLSQITFTYRNSAAGTYVIGATPSGGALVADTIVTVTAVVLASAGIGGSPQVSGNTIIGADGVVFGAVYLFATKSGGTTDAVPFGKLQDVTLKDIYSLKELDGPESLGAAAVGASKAVVTLVAKYAQINAKLWNMARGSAMSYDGTAHVTTVVRGVNDQPLKFAAHVKTPLDGSDVEILFYGCIAPDLGMDLKLHDFSMQDLTINVYGNGTDFYHLLLPNDQTG